MTGSVEPEGPGWWKAHDGRYYPPQLHPNYAALQEEASRLPLIVEAEPTSRWREFAFTLAVTVLVLVVLAGLVAANVVGTGPVDSSTLVRALFFAVVNLGAMVYCGYLGREKGYSVVAFAALGLLCSLAGVVIARLIPPRRGYV